MKKTSKIVIGSGKREYIDVKKRDVTSDQREVKQEIDTMKKQLQEIKATFESVLKDVKPDIDPDIQIHNQVREFLSKRKGKC